MWQASSLQPLAEGYTEVGREAPPAVGRGMHRGGFADARCKLSPAVGREMHRGGREAPADAKCKLPPAIGGGMHRGYTPMCPAVGGIRLFESLGKNSNIVVGGELLRSLGRELSLKKMIAKLPSLYLDMPYSKYIVINLVASI